MRMKLIALTAASLAVATPALARDFVVPYKDLDLSSAKGQKELEQRIDSAARKYCGMDAIRTGSRTRARGTVDCYLSARDAAREQFTTLIGKSQLGG